MRQMVRRRVGVYIPNGPAYFARVFKGVTTYFRGRNIWDVVNWPGVLFPNEAELKKLVAEQKIDGAIALGSRFWEALTARGKLAAVNIEYNQAPVSTIPRVGVDEASVGQLAAAHFRERGLRHLAAIGAPKSLPSAERIAAFTQAAQRWCPQPVHRHDLTHPAELAKWLASLPRPVGIFCWHDNVAVDVYQACEALEMNIPQDAAIMGVDNDDVICEAMSPALTSIDTNALRVGYEAAALLDRLMDGQPAPGRPLIVPTQGVITRASTDMLAIDNVHVIEAVRFIRAHADRSLRVEDVLDHLTVSRSSLERQFRAALGRTPRSEIARVLVERARDLLANTNLSIQTISERCGYYRPNHFTVMFHKQTGQTPTEYRRQVRLTD